MSAEQDERPQGRRSGRILRDLNIIGQLLLIAAAAGLLLSPRDDEVLLGLPDLVAGDVAPRTIKSPRAFTIPDPDTTERLRVEARARVLPTYDQITGIGADAKNRLEGAFQLMAEVPEGELPSHEEELRSRADDLMRTLRVVFSEPQLEVLLEAGFTDEVRDAAIMVVRSIHEKAIVEDKELLRLQAPDGIQIRMLGPDGLVDHEATVATYEAIPGLDEARARIDAIIAEQLAHLSAAQRRAVSLYAKRLLRPNLLPNEPETERRRKQAMAQIKTVFIQIDRGETVLRGKQTVTQRHLLILDGMAEELAGESRLQPPVGGALCVVLLLIVLYRFNRRHRGRFLPEHKDIALGATTYMGTLLMLWGCYQGAVYALEWLPNLELSAIRYAAPVAWGALLLRFVIGFEAAAAFVPLAAFTAGWLMDNSLGFAAYTLAGGFTAATVGSFARPRRGMLSAGLWAGLAQASLVLGLTLFGSRFVPSEILPAIVAALGSGVASALIAIGLVPFVEALFGYTTKMKMSEQASLNHPLLRDLLVQAPGTYHHSIVVGALAEAAARAIGADPLLAKVGGYYHDVGKLKNPRAFLENNQGQPSERRPEEEAEEIRMHVAHGLELGAQHRLGQPVLEIIAQHHGTSRIRKVQARALEEAGRGSLATPYDEAAYGYPGPRPLSREAGLVMLADFIEAAAADEPYDDRDSLRATVRRVTKDLITEAQLSACELTLAEIELASEAIEEELHQILLRRGRPRASELPSPADPRFIRLPQSPDDRPN